MPRREPLDRIGYWSELKLEIIRKYASAYSTIMARQTAIRGYGYIDAFAGPGIHVSRKTGQPVPGSPLNALLVNPPFTEYHFIDLNPQKTEHLRQLVATHFPTRKNVWIYEGDCNSVLLSDVLPRFKYADFKRALCLLDPYGLDVEWKVIEATGRSRSIDIFFNFGIMDANRNVLWWTPERVDPADLARMDKAWGDRSWLDVAYQVQDGLFGPQQEKVPGHRIAQAFRERLLTVAGFNHVPEPLPMRNTKGVVLYYLFFASPKAVAEGIVTDIFDKYR